MKIKKEFAILFFLAAVLVFYIYSEKGGKTHYNIPDLGPLETAEISKVVIDRNGAGMTLEKVKGQWVVGEKQYPADSSLIQGMIDRVSGMTLTALASESENYGLYELDEQKRISVTVYNKGDTSLRTVHIGKPASSYRHTFVMVDDDSRIFHGDGNMRGDFDRSVSDLRDKKVMAITGEITEIILNSNGEDLKIVRAVAPESSGDKEAQPQEARTWVTGDGENVTDSEVDEIVNALSDLRCDDFLEDVAKSDLSSPVFTAELKGVKSYVVSFFDKQDDKYQATSSESAYPFLLAEWKAKKIMKEFETLLNPGGK